MRKLKKLVLNAIAESGITEDEGKLSTTFEDKVRQLISVHFIDFTFKVFLYDTFLFGNRSIQAPDLELRTSMFTWWPRIKLQLVAE